jgi:hypothetical protein
MGGIAQRHVTTCGNRSAILNLQSDKIRTSIRSYFGLIWARFATVPTTSPHIHATPRVTYDPLQRRCLSIPSTGPSSLPRRTTLLASSRVCQLRTRPLDGMGRRLNKKLPCENNGETARADQAWGRYKLSLGSSVRGLTAPPRLFQSFFRYWKRDRIELSSQYAQSPATEDSCGKRGFSGIKSATRRTKPKRRRIKLGLGTLLICHVPVR